MVAALAAINARAVLSSLLGEIATLATAWPEAPATDPAEPTFFWGGRTGFVPLALRIGGAAGADGTAARQLMPLAPMGVGALVFPTIRMGEGRFSLRRGCATIAYKNCRRALWRSERRTTASKAPLRPKALAREVVTIATPILSRSSASTVLIILRMIKSPSNQAAKPPCNQAIKQQSN